MLLEMGQRIKGVSKGRLLDLCSLLNFIQDSKRMLGGSTPQMRVIFEIGTDLGLKR